MEVINHMHTKQIAMSSENYFKREECGMVFSSQQELQHHANKQHFGTA
jgi:uncharacterized C2H2 Zn-finger protein